MSKSEKTAREKNGKSASEKQNEWNNRAREIWLAGLGALAAVEEEGGKLFRNLVDKGNVYEKDKKEKLDEAWEKVSTRYKETEKKFSSQFSETASSVEDQLHSVASALGVPTRSEVENLSRKVDALIEKLDNLEKKSEKTSGTQKQSKGSSSSGSKK